MKSFHLQDDINKIAELKAGDTVLLSGNVFTARDCAHKRIYNALKNGNPPFNLKDKTVYYAGPCPANDKNIIGSIGPTTSARCDVYTPLLLDNDLKFMIGKGERNDDVIDAIKRKKCVYFSAIGGAGALYSSKIVKAELFMYEDLLSEAVYNMEIKDFPVVVAIDCKGNSIYKR